MTAIGSYRHRVIFQNPGVAVANGDGGFTQTWTDVEPVGWFVSVAPATARDLERIASGTTISQATHIVAGRYLAGVTTKTRMVFDGRTFSITGVANVEERGIAMVLTAVEVVP